MLKTLYSTIILYYLSIEHKPQIVFVLIGHSIHLFTSCNFSKTTAEPILLKRCKNAVEGIKISLFTLRQSVIILKCLQTTTFILFRKFKLIARGYLRVLSIQWGKHFKPGTFQEELNF